MQNSSHCNTKKWLDRRRKGFEREIEARRAADFIFLGIAWNFLVKAIPHDRTVCKDNIILISDCVIQGLILYKVYCN